MLTKDLHHRPRAAPVLYPGSIERKSIAEADEAKGFLVVEVSLRGDEVKADWEFRPLPARPQVVEELSLDQATAADLESRVRAMVANAPPDAVLTIRVRGEVTGAAARCLSAAFLRSIAPTTMNIELRMPDVRDRSVGARRAPDEPELLLRPRVERLFRCNAGGYGR